MLIFLSPLGIARLSAEEEMVRLLEFLDMPKRGVLSCVCVCVHVNVCENPTPVRGGRKRDTPGVRHAENRCAAVCMYIYADVGGNMISHEKSQHVVLLVV